MTKTRRLRALKRFGLHTFEERGGHYGEESATRTVMQEFDDGAYVLLTDVEAALLSEPQAAQEPELCPFCGRLKSAHDSVTIGAWEQRVRCPVEIPPVLPAPPEGQ